MMSSYLYLMFACCCLYGIDGGLTINMDQQARRQPQLNPTWPPPPKWNEKAKMARYLAHYSDWGVVSSISPDFNYVPFGTLQSFADGPMNNSSGTPYFYMADISDTRHNIEYNNTVSLFMSEAESPWCDKYEQDPEEPTCARLTLIGQVVAVTPEEQGFAKEALFTRHPAMQNWPTHHHWRFYKLNIFPIDGICLLDFYGGATHITLDEYLKAKPL